MNKLVTTFYLEMNHKDDFSPKAGFQKKMSIEKITGNVIQHWMLFFGVGLPWRWYSRLKWTVEDWRKYLSNPQVSTYVGFSGGKMVGFFELVNRDGEVEINFFGLFPDSIGSGYGGFLLSHAIEKSWNSGAKRVWLHTCTSDHESALNNYLARGFKVIDQTSENECIPEKEDYRKFLHQFMDQFIAENWD